MSEFIPTHLQGHPAGELLAEIHAAARARGLTVKREWRAARYGGSAVYTVLRGGAVDLTVTIDGAEGKTLRSKSSQQLQELLAHLLASPELDAEDLPTQPVPGTYLLADDQADQLRRWGVLWDRERRAWLSPASRLAEVTAYLAPRRATNLGKLSVECERILQRTVREADRRQGAGYEWTVLDAALPAYREAVRLRETWVGLGKDFPRSANDELRDLGARWDHTGWSVRLCYEAQAREIIARHREQARVEAKTAAAQREAQAAAEQATGIIRWSRGEGYGGENLPQGELVFNPTREASGWYVITACRRQYYREDGMSFGVGDESGYVYSYAARPATAEEAAPREAARQAGIARRAAIQEFDNLFRETFNAGAWVPGSHCLDGEEIEHPAHGHNLVGGGEWFVITDDSIWAVRNNGMDGDDWSRNNVRTGGAGAIGRRVPYDAALAARIRDAARRAGPVHRIDALAGVTEPGD